MTKYAALGTQLQMGDGGGPENFATITGLQALGGPELSTDILDVTAHDSPNKFEEVVTTILRSGRVTATVIYDPATATHNQSTGFLNKWKNRTKTNFKLILTDVALSQWTFAAYVTKASPTMNFDGALTIDLELKVSGAVTLP